MYMMINSKQQASFVNKRFIIRLKKALKVFHEFHVILCGKCSLVLGVSTAGAGSPSVIMLLKISNSRLKQGFSKSAINSLAIRRHFRKILSSSAILISSSKGHKCGIIWDNAQSIGLAIEHFDWLILVIGPLSA